MLKNKNSNSKAIRTASQKRKNQFWTIRMDSVIGLVVWFWIVGGAVNSSLVAEPDIIVQFKEGVTELEAKEFDRGKPISLVYSFHIVPASAYKVYAHSEDEALNIIERLKQDPKVKDITDAGSGIKLDYQISSASMPFPNGDDPFSPDASLSKREVIPWGVEYLGAPEVWGKTEGGGITVGVIDTGIASNHPDLRVDPSCSANFVEGKTNWNDENGHGTHVAGIIAALRNGVGVVGVAPGVRLCAVRVLDEEGSGSLYQIMRGVEWAVDQKMHLVNMSLGINLLHLPFVRAVIHAAGEKGLLLIAAAGNSNVGATLSFVGSPAVQDYVVAVGSATNYLTASIFSQRPQNPGNKVDYLMAPGEYILSSFFDKDTGPTYAVLSGTSMASPHVVGAAALIWSAHPEWTSQQVKEALFASTLTDKKRPFWFRFSQVAQAFGQSPSPFLEALIHHPESENNYVDFLSSMLKRLTQEHQRLLTKELSPGLDEEEKMTLFIDEILYKNLELLTYRPLLLGWAYDSGGGRAAISQLITSGRFAINMGTLAAILQRINSLLVFLQRLPLRFFPERLFPLVNTWDIKTRDFFSSGLVLLLQEFRNWRGEEDTGDGLERLVFQTRSLLFNACASEDHLQTVRMCM